MKETIVGDEDSINPESHNIKAFQKAYQELNITAKDIVLLPFYDKKEEPGDNFDVIDFTETVGKDRKTIDKKL